MIALAGLGAGALHVVSGPDHLAALGPVASSAPERAVRLGALWGVGHGIGVLSVAGVARVGVEALDLSALSGWAELAVGFVLILLGLRAFRAREHDHSHAPTGSALGVGLLHGAAGAHHLFAVLPSLLLEPTEAAIYLGGYLVAAVAAMATAGALVAVGLRGRDASVRARVHRAFGAAAVLTGICWVGLSLV
jgi:nickel/cobalt exporter